MCQCWPHNSRVDNKDKPLLYYCYWTASHFSKIPGVTQNIIRLRLKVDTILILIIEMKRELTGLLDPQTKLK